MGYKTGFAYDFGVGMGLASYQGSVMHDTERDTALQWSQFAVNNLMNSGVIPKHNVYGEIFNQSSLESARLQYKNEIGMNSNVAANAYQLGLFIAIAEGQTSGPGDKWNLEVDIAKSSLLTAQKIIIQNFYNIQFDLSLLQEAINRTENFGKPQGDAYAQIKLLRTTYTSTIHNANLE